MIEKEEGISNTDFGLVLIEMIRQTQESMEEARRAGNHHDRKELEDEMNGQLDVLAEVLKEPGARGPIEVALVLNQKGRLSTVGSRILDQAELKVRKSDDSSRGLGLVLIDIIARLKGDIQKAYHAGNSIESKELQEQEEDQLEQLADILKRPGMRKNIEDELVPDQEVQLPYVASMILDEAEVIATGYSKER
jgi:uncharacterized protein YajQ (UPF0234 family)